MSRGLRILAILLLAPLLLSLTPIYIGTDWGCSKGRFYRDAEGYHIVLSLDSCSCGCDVLAELLVANIEEGHYKLRLTYRIDEFEQSGGVAKLVAPSLLIADKDLRFGIEVMPSWKIWDGVPQLAYKEVVLLPPLSVRDEFSNFYKIVFPKDPRLLIGVTVNVELYLTATKLNGTTLIVLREVKVAYKELGESYLFDKEISVALVKPVIVFYVRSGVYVGHALRELSVTIENVTLVKKAVTVERRVAPNITINTTKPMLLHVLNLLTSSDNFLSLPLGKALTTRGLRPLLLAECYLDEAINSIKSYKEEEGRLESLLDSPPTVANLNKIRVLVQMMNVTLTKAMVSLNVAENVLKSFKLPDVVCKGNATYYLIKLLKANSTGEGLKLLKEVERRYGSLEDLVTCFLREERDRGLAYALRLRKEVERLEIKGGVYSRLLKPVVAG